MEVTTKISADEVFRASRIAGELFRRAVMGTRQKIQLNVISALFWIPVGVGIAVAMSISHTIGIIFLVVCAALYLEPRACDRFFRWRSRVVLGQAMEGCGEKTYTLDQSGLKVSWATGCEQHAWADLSGALIREGLVLVLLPNWQAHAIPVTAFPSKEGAKSFVERVNEGIRRYSKK